MYEPEQTSNTEPLTEMGVLISNLTTNSKLMSRELSLLKKDHDLISRQIKVTEKNLSGKNDLSEIILKLEEETIECHEELEIINRRMNELKKYERCSHSLALFDNNGLL